MASIEDQCKCGHYKVNHSWHRVAGIVKYRSCLEDTDCECYIYVKGE